MNHSYQSDKLTNLCAKCKRQELDHSETAQCEACPNIGPCDVINGMLLCATCYEHDKELEIQDSKIPADNPADRITQLVNQLGREIPTESREYFVGEVTSIVSIEQTLKAEQVENPQYKLAEIVEQRIQSFRRNLFEVKKMELELKVKMVSDQKYLNQIVPQLREEEREKFKAYDITYKPNAPVAATTSSKPRMSASDRSMEVAAKALNITVEQYRMILTNAVKNVTGNQCTCKETPGLCKIHPS